MKSPFSVAKIKIKYLTKITNFKFKFFTPFLNLRNKTALCSEIEIYFPKLSVIKI